MADTSSRTDDTGEGLFAKWIADKLTRQRLAFTKYATVKQLQVPDHIPGPSSAPMTTRVELQLHTNLSWVISAHALLRIASGTAAFSSVSILQTSTATALT